MSASTRSSAVHAARCLALLSLVASTAAGSRQSGASACGPDRGQAAPTAATPTAVAIAAGTVPVTSAMEIPDASADGLTLGPLRMTATGVVEGVSLSVSIAHAHAGDLTFALTQDVDADGEPDLTIPIVMVDRLDGPWEPGACPVVLDGAYLFESDPESDGSGPGDGVTAARADGDWYLTIVDGARGDEGSVSAFSMTVKTVLASVERAPEWYAGSALSGIGAASGTCGCRVTSD